MMPTMSCRAAQRGVAPRHRARGKELAEVGIPERLDEEGKKPCKFYLVHGEPWHVDLSLL